MSNLSARQVQRSYSNMLERGFSAQKVLHHHRVLSQALGQAVKWDMLSQNVAMRITPPKGTKPELRILTFAEVRRLIDAARGTEYYLPIYLALYTGLRRSEIFGLRWSDVELEAHALNVIRTMISLKGDRVHISEPKSRKSRRVVAIGAEVIQTLRERQAAQSFRRGARDSQVCARSGGGIMKPDALAHGYKTIAKGCAITGVRFHDLRHTPASPC